MFFIASFCLKVICDNMLLKVKGQHGKHRQEAVEDKNTCGAAGRVTCPEPLLQAEPTVISWPSPPTHQHAGERCRPAAAIRLPQHRARPPLLPSPRIFTGSSIITDTHQWWRQFLEIFTWFMKFIHSCGRYHRSPGFFLFRCTAGGS